MSTLEVLTAEVGLSLPWWKHRVITRGVTFNKDEDISVIDSETLDVAEVAIDPTSTR